VGRSLFAIEDNFIDSMCLGMDDSSAKNELAEALEAGRLEMLKALHARLQSSPWKDRAEEFTVVLQGGRFVIIAPADLEDEVLDSEYGNQTERPHPVLRQAAAQSRPAIERAINKKLALR